MALYKAMLQDAQERLQNKDLYGYFGVGTSSPLPFESDIVRRNSIPALLVKALAETGLRMDASATIQALLSLEPEGQPFAFFHMLHIL